MSGWRHALRIGLVLTCLAGAGYGGAAPARAAAAFSTELSGLPDEFTAGNRVETLSAVVSRSDRANRDDCVKVRWSMLLRVQGLRLDQVKVDRVEETGSFPLEIRTEGDTARLTDRELDPGVLCPGRTVTARYRVAFAEDVGRGQVSIAAEAYDPQLRLLARRTASRQVVGEAAAPTPEPTATSAEPTDPPSEEPVAEESETDESTDPAVVEPPANAAGQPVASTGGFGVVQAAFLLGGLLLFLGAGLLFRMRRLLRPAGDPDGDLAPSFERRRTRRRGR
ncbi:hypothetical protein [Micromonospora robiginosa]|uniref:Uncharacterized protein n=1 Tax=Micromonospora robiginosa TaxID=2749844 RepID=A0A7L6BDP5_9ACTN|nr:hypothetical protein [Micromonospora ferruginea]QLQ40059.1 hypothetical protein H1D33_15275 [Micromonospora ferruginea]